MNRLLRRMGVFILGLISLFSAHAVGIDPDVKQAFLSAKGNKWVSILVFF